ncbi:hypothetical protein ACSBR1_030626 [Camellia fascicularis]
MTECAKGRLIRKCTRWGLGGAPRGATWVEVRRAAKARLPLAREAKLLGKRPTDNMFKDHLNLHNFVKEALLD